MVTGSVISKDVRQALASLTPDGRKLFDKISEKINSLAKVDLMTRYDVGTYIKQASEDERKYGEGFVRIVATLLGYKYPNKLYQFEAIAQRWTRAQMLELAKLRTTAGRQLTFTHFHYLASIDNEKQRDAMLDKCLKQNLTSTEMQAQVPTLRGQKGQGGRPRVAPRSPQAGLATMQRYAHQFLASHEIFEQSIFDRMADKPDEVASDELLAEIDQTEIVLIELQDLIAKDRRKLVSARDTVSRALQSRRTEEVTRPRSAAAKKIRPAAAAEASPAPSAGKPRPTGPGGQKRPSAPTGQKRPAAAAGGAPPRKMRPPQPSTSNGSHPGPSPAARQAAKKQAAKRQPAGAR